MNRRFPYISLLKTLAMLMVVLLHSSLYFVNFNPFWPLKANAPDAVVDGMVRVLECMVVPGFFMASGFLLTRSLCVSSKGWLAQAAGRSKRLLLPYFVTGILYLVPVYTLLDLPSFMRPEGAGWTDGYSAFFRGQFADHLWFLMALCWSTLVFLCMAPLLRKRSTVWAAAALSVGLAWLNTTYMSHWCYYNLSQLAQPLLMMALGAVLFHNHVLLERMGRWNLLTGGLVLTVGILCIIHWTDGNPAWHTRNFLCTLGLALLLYGMVGEKPCRLQQTRAGMWFEKNSMLFYLLHSPFPLICFVYIYRNSEWVQSLPGAIYVSIFFPLAVLCTILLTRSVVKILSKINPPQSGKA